MISNLSAKIDSCFGKSQIEIPNYIAEPLYKCKKVDNSIEKLVFNY